jgi:hypothetical protein
MADQHKNTDYHDAHMNDPAEWEVVEEEATVRPSGMTIFSLRYPSSELDTLRALAREKGLSVGEIIRAAVRAYLNPVRIYGQVGNLATTQFSEAANAQDARLQTVTLVPTRSVRAEAAARPRLVEVA